MEGIVWVLIIIFWLVFSAVRQINKQKQKYEKQIKEKPQETTSSSPESTLPTFKQIMAEIRRQSGQIKTGEFEEQRPVEVKTIQPQLIKKERVTTESNVIKEQPFLDYENEVRQQNKKQRETVKQTEKKMQIEDFEEYDSVTPDLKTLVISDAILNRKEW